MGIVGIESYRAIVVLERRVEPTEAIQRISSFVIDLGTRRRPLRAQAVQLNRPCQLTLLMQALRFPE
jgi:hypothetical protein